MHEYTVVWVVELQAEDAHDAANRARDTMMGQVCYDSDPPEFYVTLTEHLGDHSMHLDLTAMSHVG